jgi:hypothetical protein
MPQSVFKLWLMGRQLWLKLVRSTLPAQFQDKNNVTIIFAEKENLPLLVRRGEVRKNPALTLQIKR